jgi:hypothetical protein
MLQRLLFLVATFGALAWTGAFTRGPRTRHFNFRLGDSYREALERAKAAKLQKQGGAVSPPPAPVARAPAPAPPAAPSSSSMTRPAPVAAVPADSGLPFTDDMYEHLKFVIGKLSARMRTDTPLTREELARFQASADRIIDDAWGRPPSSSSAGAPATST